MGNSHVTGHLMEGKWSCYRGGQFNGHGVVMLRRWSVKWRENGITEVVSLMEREWSCYGGGQFNRGSMIVREVVSLMEGEWLCYGGGQFNGGSMVMWSL